MIAALPATELPIDLDAVGLAHATLIFLGKEDELGDDQLSEICNRVAYLCSGGEQITGTVAGVGNLGDQGATVFILNSDGLCDMHKALQGDLEPVGLAPPWQHDGYIGHVTAGYDRPVDDPELQGQIGQPIVFDRIAVVKGSDIVHETPLKPTMASRVACMQSSVVASPLFKKKWSSELHPRAHDGKFIEKGGFIHGLLTFLSGDSKGMKAISNGKVTGFRPNKSDPNNPIVMVETKHGPAAILADEVQKAATPKAVLPSLPPKPVRTPEEQFADALAKVNEQAQELSDTDPEARMAVLNKIMGGVRGTPMSSASLYNKGGKSHDQWTEARMAQHEQLWQQLLQRAEAAGVPRDKKGFVIGGLPGSGKSSGLAKRGIDGWDGLGPTPKHADYFVMNPDVIKEMMIENGMLLPGVDPKIKPMEQVSFIHAESNYLTAMFLRRMADEGYNVVYDTTMANVPHIKKNLGPLKDAGYGFDAAFLDISREESRLNAQQRYLQDWQTPQGGRFVPSEASTSNSNRRVFEDMTDWFNDWQVIDNSGVSKGTPAGTLIESGHGKIDRTPVFETGGDGVPGGYNGYYVAYTKDGRKMGYLDYQIITDKRYDDGKVKISMVEVAPEFRDRGIGTQLIDKLHEDNLDREIDLGYLTEEGAQLWESWKTKMRLRARAKPSTNTTNAYANMPMFALPHDVPSEPAGYPQEVATFGSLLAAVGPLERSDWRVEQMIRQGNADDALLGLRNGELDAPAPAEDDDDYEGKSSLFSELYAAGRWDLAPQFDDVVRTRRLTGF